ncbi:MAG: thioredoxin family protein [Gammaproteobacteria bacterium]|nr:thioredoxin family protein [Gammaproteobacteria bacterium]
MTKIEVFTAPGCGKCGKAKDELEAIVNQLGNDKFEWREVNILQEMDYAIELGVLSTPSIVINGDLVFTALPSARQLLQALENSMGA